ncbi:MAG: universal stress protein, partial [Sporomusaceae bacterium]|nr:universal stress protein [Sporomusaceae bacterium]
MGTFNSILVPIDGSSNSKRVLLYAGKLSELFGARLGILYVASIPRILPVFDHIHTGAYIPAQALEDAVEAGRAIADEALAMLPPEIEAEAFVETGVPSDVIIKFCNQHKYDLI